MVSFTTTSAADCCWLAVFAQATFRGDFCCSTSSSWSPEISTLPSGLAGSTASVDGGSATDAAVALRCEVGTSTTCNGNPAVAAADASPPSGTSQASAAAAVATSVAGAASVAAASAIQHPSSPTAAAGRVATGKALVAGDSSRCVGESAATAGAPKSRTSSRQCCPFKLGRAAAVVAPIRNPATSEASTDAAGETADVVPPRAASNAGAEADVAAAAQDPGAALEGAEARRTSLKQSARAGKPAAPWSARPTLEPHLEPRCPLELPGFEQLPTKALDRENGLPHSPSPPCRRRALRRSLTWTVL
mmetsp:Transcript_54678/g.146365  ORF Transcript_54678/g.146365 Transcript_54678/m.146365 type:complete len:305 (-) Transcript_54678:244-1158(-)